MDWSTHTYIVAIFWILLIAFWAIIYILWHMQKVLYGILQNLRNRGISN